MSPWRRFPRLIPSVMLLAALPACIGTQVKFYTVVAKTRDSPDGWQEACLEALIQNMTTEESHVCAVGIGMPIQNMQNGYISAWDAGEIAADCINMAADRAIRPASADNPTALVCSSFRNTLSQLLAEKVKGSRVNQGCKQGIPPTRVGF